MGGLLLGHIKRILVRALLSLNKVPKAQMRATASNMLAPSMTPHGVNKREPTVGMILRTSSYVGSMERSPLGPIVEIEYSRVLGRDLIQAGLLR